MHPVQVTTLDAVPDIEMLIYLPEILDGLLIILGDQNQEIRQMWVQDSQAVSGKLHDAA